MFVRVGVRLRLCLRLRLYIDLLRSLRISRFYSAFILSFNCHSWHAWHTGTRQAASCMRIGLPARQVVILPYVSECYLCVLILLCMCPQRLVKQPRIRIGLSARQVGPGAIDSCLT
jgi:hypothetical protein